MTDLKMYSSDELEGIERHLIPFLNKVRKAQGKPPVIVPKPKKETGDWRLEIELGPRPAGVPWRFKPELGKADPRAIPEGNLHALTKQALLYIALDYGYQTETLYPKKAEYVEALAWLRGVLG